MEKWKRISKSLFTNPILIILYLLFCYELASVCKYGRVNNNIYILFISFIFIIAMIVYVTIKEFKNKELDFEKKTISKRKIIISTSIIIAITSIYGVSIYKSGTNYGGKLAWVIQRLKNERKVEFIHDNIYDYGVEGIFQDINEKYALPEELYMSDSFELEYDNNGIITSFDTFVYGKDEDEKDKSYLITYDKSKSEDIKIILNGNVNANYDENKLVKPLINTVNAIEFENIVNKYNENKYGLVYFGKRSFGYNTDGIIYINNDGEEYTAEQMIEENPQFTNSYELIGYTVSIFIPGREEITPSRYNLMTRAIFNEADILEEQEKFHGEKEEATNNNEVFYYTKDIGYRLDEVDHALGSIFYSFSKTIDGGKTWQVINENPFGGAIGSVSDITFINEKLGFIISSKNGGANGELYRTDDGGINFYYINYEPYEVELNNGVTFNPFDYPTLPYEENGVLNMKVGQGSDGDYNGNSSALYQSKDDGNTWEFIKEIK